MTAPATRLPLPIRAHCEAMPGLGQPRTRVLIKPDAPKHGHVDGAWWPYSNDLVAELPGLITTLAPRCGPVLLVAYYLVDWETPDRPLVVDDRPVRIAWQGHTSAHTVDLFGDRGRPFVLLVVPPDTGAGDACITMQSAADPDNTSTVNELLHPRTRRRRYAEW
ncbi:hypothetical protein GZH49_36405 [Nocardia terpenica]|uniref:DUF5994 family protein n=1 Tax=Nocardia terpenica TaxID=455432 RepID=UPI002FE261FC